MSEAYPPRADLDRLDLVEIKRFLARRWTWILGTAFACTMLAAFVCVAMTPLYTATSQVLLDPRKPHAFGQEPNADAALDSSVVDSQLPIITSTRLLAKVIDKEHLADDPEFSGPLRRGVFDRLFGGFEPIRQIPVNAASLDGIDSKLQPIILRLLDRVDVVRVAKSYVISISVASRDPDKAMRLADALAAIYVEDQVDVSSKSVRQTAGFFEDRIGSLREQVRQSEQAVADYRQAHHLTTTTMDGSNTLGQQQLQGLNEQLALAATDTAEKHALYDQGAHFKLDGMDLDTLPDIIRSPVITQLRTQAADLTRRASDLAVMYGPAYPAITQIRAQRAGIDKAIAAEMKRLLTTLKNSYDVAQMRETSLRKTIADLTETSGGDNEVGVKLRELERVNLANKALFETFLSRAKLTQEQSTFEEPDARVISPALQPASPSWPKIKLILPVSLVVGLILGLGLGAFLDYLQIAAPTEGGDAQSAAADAFILARIPEMPIRRGARADMLAFLDREPDSAFANGIDSLTAKLLPNAGETRTLLLTPLGAGEGASSLALCVAAMGGLAGKRILLIDADQAGHGLSSALGCASSVGLGEVITGRLSANKAVISRPSFAMLPAGQTRLSAARVRSQLKAFLVETRDRFDLILIDAPAFGTDADMAALCSLVDGVAIVACWETLMREAFIAAIDAAAEQPNFLGLIMNRTNRAVGDAALAS